LRTRVYFQNGEDLGLKFLHLGMPELKRRIAYTRGPKWTKIEEQALLRYLNQNGFDAKGLSRLFPNRTAPSIRSKVRKLRIKNDLFGNAYREQKKEFTLLIAKQAKPKIVFDAYAGAGHQTFEWLKFADVVYACETMRNKISQFKKEAKANQFRQLKGTSSWMTFKKGNKKVHYFIGDAVDAACLLKHQKIKVDVIDLDTCGSTIPTIPIYLTLLKPKHLVITHGEFHSLRFQRDDVLRRLLCHLNIATPSLPLTVEEMSLHLDRAVKTAALRSHNETTDSFWLDLMKETWLGSKFHGMLRRHYKVHRPKATSDCINMLS
jgi:hypothetical protein